MNCKDLPTIDHCIIAARGNMTLLSKEEVQSMMEVGNSPVHTLFRKCCLAVLNCDAKEDDAMAVLERYPDFDVRLLPRERGIHLEFFNAPAQALTLFSRTLSWPDPAIMMSTPLRALPISCLKFCVAEKFTSLARNPIWWCAGAVTPSPGTNTSTPKTWVTSWVCAAWTPAPAAAREP